MDITMHACFLSAIVTIFGFAMGQQPCGRVDLLFAIDMSENARGASDNFRIIKSALTTFLNNPRLVGAPRGNVQIGAFGYGSQGTRELIPYPSTQARALDSLSRNLDLRRPLSDRSLGGSRTFVGIEHVTGGVNSQAIRPTYSLNRLFIISSQGQARYENQTRNAMNNLQWNPTVIAVKGAHDFAVNDLRNANRGRPFITVPNYNSLAARLTQILDTELCPDRTTTTTYRPRTYPTRPRITRPPIIQPRSTPYTGICANCEGSDGRDRDPLYCDRFFDCRVGQNPIPRKCPAGTFFDDWRGCNHIANVSCPLAPCGPADEGRRYPSGTCCNKYFLCSSGGKIKSQLCPADQIFDQRTSNCVFSTEPVKSCGADGRFFCDADKDGPVDRSKCPPYLKSDPTGDPCVFLVANYKMSVPRGTFWDAKSCALNHLPKSFRVCTDFTSDRVSDIDGGFLSDTCCATFRTLFSSGVNNVINDCNGRESEVYSILQGTTMEDRALSFPQPTDRAGGAAAPFLYYYQFISKEFTQDTGFRIRFRLEDNVPTGQDFDLMSNNYCLYCPETISVTVRKVSAGTQEVMATFVPTTGPAAITTAAVNVQNNDMVEAIIIFGRTELYGQLNTLNAFDPEGRPRQIVNFQRIQKNPEALILANKCGIQFGRGNNNMFVGTIHSFSLFESCKNIDDILRT